MRKLVGETGQALVQVALLIVVLLGIVALAVDVGHLYQERRQMQNAADAGALAGARALCLDLGDDTVRAWVEEYRTRNGGSGPTAAINGSDVVVTSNTTSQTFVARVIGIPSALVSAQATGHCGCASGICGAFPVAYNKTSFFAAAQSCGHRFLLWDSDLIDCVNYDCEGMSPVPVTGRAWVDFSALLADNLSDPCDQTGCGNSELRDRINGATGTTACRSYIKIPDCMAGDGGVKSSSWAEVENKAASMASAGTPWVVRIPLWDTMGCTMDADPGNTCGTNRYHVVAASCVKILGVKRLSPVSGGGPKVKVVVAEIVCPDSPEAGDCFTACGGSSGPDTLGCMKAANLTR